MRSAGSLQGWSQQRQRGPHPQSGSDVELAAATPPAREEEKSITCMNEASFGRVQVPEGARKETGLGSAFFFFFTVC